jgi:hypothetical protein
MPKTKPPMKPWVKVLGPLVRDALSDWTRRPFVFQQSGPFTNDQTGLFFNEEKLRAIRSPVSTDRADFRFGYAIWRYYSPHSDTWIVTAGFVMWNKALTRVRFMRHVRENAANLEQSLLRWLRRHKGHGFIHFDQEHSERYEATWDSTKSPSLAKELKKYGDLDRKSTGKHKDRPGGNVGSRLSVTRRIPEMLHLSDRELKTQAPSLVGSLLAAFQELDFLYELLLRPVVQRSEAPPFEPNELEQFRERIQAQIASRLGQPEFRRALLRAYQSRCPVSGCDVEAALQAAHLFPHTGEKSNHCANGILLRADLHNLFDRHLMAIEPVTRTIRIAPVLRGTSYAEYEGKLISLPSDAAEAPHPEALEFRFRLFKETMGN